MILAGWEVCITKVIVGQCMFKKYHSGDGKSKGDTA